MKELFPFGFIIKRYTRVAFGIMANACSFWLYQKTNVIDDVQTYEKRFPFGLIRKRYALRAFGSMNYEIKHMFSGQNNENVLEKLPVFAF